MNKLRLGVALVFAGLYAALMVRVLVTGASDAIAAATPIATLAVTYILGMEAVKALRNGKRDRDDDRPPQE